MGAETLPDRLPREPTAGDLDELVAEDLLYHATGPALAEEIDRCLQLERDREAQMVKGDAYVQSIQDRLERLAMELRGIAVGLKLGGRNMQAAELFASAMAQDRARRVLGQF